VVLHKIAVCVEEIPRNGEKNALEITSHIAMKRRVEAASGVPAEEQQLAAVVY
jgi:hypothetical protein